VTDLYRISPRANARLAVEFDPQSGSYPDEPTGEACAVCREVLTAFELAVAQEAGGAPRCAACIRLDRRPGRAQGAGEPRFCGLTFAEAKAAEIPPRRELVEDLIDIGTVGEISGLPFARKSWLALDIAHRVAAREGLVLGRYPVLAGGPVLYVWQDDAYAKELERIQAYARAHPELSDTLPLRYLLNEGLRLPDDIGELEALVQREGIALVVVDSLYNVLPPGLSLKDEEVALVLAEVKAKLCDPLGCTFAFVDHAPWPNEQNRGQRRAYGSVFKAAAVRWAIHLEADPCDDAKLYLEARGNNVSGFRRSPAYWDEETLEIRLLDTASVADEEYKQRVLEYLQGRSWTSSNRIVREVKGRAERLLRALQSLEEAGRVTSASSRALGRGGSGTYWILASEAESALFPRGGKNPEDPVAGSVTSAGGLPLFPPPIGGEDPPREEPVPPAEEGIPW
jgi:hypothetical protein